MNLHHNKIHFDELIIATSNEFGISKSIIEKDYYVTLVLNELSKNIPDMVFKGGTSLTKCYQLLDRFSEDIDLSYNISIGNMGESKKRKLKQAIIQSMANINTPVYNVDQTRSRRQYNCYRAKYTSLYNSNIVKTELIVETYIALLPFPTSIEMVDSYIYRYLKKYNYDQLIDQYNLHPFQITTQSIERTLIDKVFALCDYYLTNKTDNHSRHIYDIHKIIKKYGIPSNLNNLVNEVRLARSKLDICPSAKEDMDICKIIKEIIGKQIYKDDYESITMNLLFTPIPYDQAIKSLQLMANQDIWK